MKKLLIFLTTVLMAGILMAAEPTGIVAHWTMNISPLPSDGLVAYWALDDNTTNPNIVDSAGSNTGTFSDAGGDPCTAAHSTTGNIQTALTFDGSDDLITVPADPSIDGNGRSALTISAWIYTTGDGGTAGVGRIIQKATYPGANPGYYLYVKDKVGSLIDLVCNFYTTEGNAVSASAAVTIDKWEFVTAVFGGGRVKLYLNAEVIGDVSAVGSTIGDDSGDDLYIGNNSANTQEFEGNIDDVRIYSRALSPSEISNLYNATIVRDSRGTNNGTYADAAGNLNASEYTTAGKINSALTFDGSDDYIDTGDPFQSTFRDSFSISLWFKSDDGDSDSHIFSTVATSGGSGNRVRIFLTSGQLVGQYSANSNTTDATTGVLLSDGQEPWHHIVVTVENGGVISFYFDGDLEDTGDASGVTFNDYTNTFNPFIGARNNAGTDDNYYSGPIDNVMIFDRALSLRDIQTLYRNGNGTENIADLDKQRRIRRGINRF